MPLCIIYVLYNNINYRENPPIFTSNLQKILSIMSNTQNWKSKGTLEGTISLLVTILLQLSSNYMILSSKTAIVN